LSSDYYAYLMSQRTYESQEEEYLKQLIEQRRKQQPQPQPPQPQPPQPQPTQQAQPEAQPKAPRVGSPEQRPATVEFERPPEPQPQTKSTFEIIQDIESRAPPRVGSPERAKAVEFEPLPQPQPPRYEYPELKPTATATQSSSSSLKKLEIEFESSQQAVKQQLASSRQAYTDYLNQIAPKQEVKVEKAPLAPKPQPIEEAEGAKEAVKLNLVLPVNQNPMFTQGTQTTNLPQVQKAIAQQQLTQLVNNPLDKALYGWQEPVREKIEQSMKYGTPLEKAGALAAAFTIGVASGLTGLFSPTRNPIISTAVLATSPEAREQTVKHLTTPQGLAELAGGIAGSYLFFSGVKALAGKLEAISIPGEKITVYKLQAVEPQAKPVEGGGVEVKAGVQKIELGKVVGEPEFRLEAATTKAGVHGIIAEERLAGIITKKAEVIAKEGGVLVERASPAGKSLALIQEKGSVYMDVGKGEVSVRFYGEYAKPEIISQYTALAKPPSIIDKIHTVLTRGESGLAPLERLVPEPAGDLGYGVGGVSSFPVKGPTPIIPTIPINLPETTPTKAPTPTPSLTPPSGGGEGKPPTLDSKALSQLRNLEIEFTDKAAKAPPPSQPPQPIKPLPDWGEETENIKDIIGRHKDISADKDKPAEGSLPTSFPIIPPTPLPSPPIPLPAHKPQEDQQGGQKGGEDQKGGQKGDDDQGQKQDDQQDILPTPTPTPSPKPLPIIPREIEWLRFRPTPIPKPKPRTDYEAGQEQEQRQGGYPPIPPPPPPPPPPTPSIQIEELTKPKLSIDIKPNIVAMPTLTQRKRKYEERLNPFRLEFNIMKEFSKGSNWGMFYMWNQKRKRR